MLISVYMIAGGDRGNPVRAAWLSWPTPGHMLTDAAAIAMALGAMWLAGKEASVRRTFGYHRTEVLAALINAGALWVIAAWILLEAYHRFTVEGTEGIDGLTVLLVGTGGLLINLARGLDTSPIVRAQHQRRRCPPARHSRPAWFRRRYHLRNSHNDVRVDDCRPYSQRRHRVAYRLQHPAPALYDS